MIFIDSDVFLIDLIFKGDKRYNENKNFLSHRLVEKKSTSVFNLLEICGTASFNLSMTDIEDLFKDFHHQFDLKILYPATDTIPARIYLSSFIKTTMDKIKTKMNYQDVVILNIAEEYNISYFITWNTKHFKDRTHLEVMNPKQFFETKGDD